MTPTLDIVIVNYNTRDDLDACLTSLTTHPPQLLHRIFVVDNASTDGSPDHVRRRWPRVALKALSRNIGFGAANNVAMRESDADLLLLLNSDTLVPAGAIETLAGRLIATSAVAAGPRLVDGTGRPEVSFGRMLSPWTELVQRFRVRLSSREGGFGERYISRLVGRERGVDWVTGACLLVRRQAASDAGFFDERYFMYEEDVDFCAALRAGGGRVLYTPRAEVVHLRGRSIARSDAGLHTYYDRSHLAFYDKHAPGWAWALRLWQKARRRTADK